MDIPTFQVVFFAFDNSFQIIFQKNLLNIMAPLNLIYLSWDKWM